MEILSVKLFGEELSGVNTSEKNYLMKIQHGRRIPGKNLLSEGRIS
jgi:hypothetical protein